MQPSSMQNPSGLSVTSQGRTYNGSVADSATGIRRFAGIRFAAAPVGNLRWQPPQPLPAEVPAQLDDGFGPACYQPFSADSFVWRRGEFPRSEDCLFLNLWAPAQNNTTNNASKDWAGKKPVMVWFHGGSHTGGYGHSKIFDGTSLANRGVILVSINYRLGVFGFLSHPELAKESPANASGNYGLLDKVAALQWVRDNILQFGGDPDNVTIFGQSAGSMSVCALLAAQSTQGLFHKAIGQSAACFPSPLAAPGDPTGQDEGQRMAGKSDLAELRAMDTATIAKLAESTAWAPGSKIVVDGLLLTEPVTESFANRRQHAVPTMVGSLANEGHLLFPLSEDLTEAKLRTRLQRQFGEHAKPLLNLYADDLAQSPGLAQREIYTDLFMAWNMRRWARYSNDRQQPTYLYFLAHPIPAFALYTPDNPSLNLPDGPRSAGAYHSADLALVFGNTRIVGEHWSEFDHKLADQMADYWTNFARHGNPNGTGLTPWPEFDVSNHTLVLQDPIAAQAGVRQSKLDLFDAVFQPDDATNVSKQIDE